MVARISGNPAEGINFVGGHFLPEFGFPGHRCQDGVGYSKFLDAGAVPKPGIRTQIAVCDYNGDGKPDLLVGNFFTYIRPRAELLGLRAKMDTLYPKVQAGATGYVWLFLRK